jgi:hypothetical protein
LQLAAWYTAKVRQLAERLRRARITLATALASALGASVLAGCTVPLQGTCATCDSADAGTVVDATSGVGPSADSGSDALGAHDAEGGNDSSDSASDSPAAIGTQDETGASGCTVDGACGEAGSEDECGACCSEGGCEPDASSTPSESDAATCAAASDCAPGEACNTTTSQCQPSCNDGALCNGCCDAIGNCQPGTDPSGCGNDGGLCATCTDGRTCMQGSYCSCRAAADCPPGLACKQGTGECQPSCNGGALCNGCCDQGFGSGMCQMGTSPTQCNTGGHTCQICACPKPVCVPFVPNAGAASTGGTCGCSTDEDCKPACSGPTGQYRSVCTAESCQ